MLVIGERINATRKSIFRAISEKDAEFIKKEARDQLNAGADMLDVNCGTSDKGEMEDIEWLVNTVQEVADVRLVIDSPNPLVLEKGLGACKKKAMVNSITGEKDKIEKILPLVKKFDTEVVALTLDDSGMPHTAHQRFDIAKKILEETSKQGVPNENVYFDPLVRPVSTEPDQGREFLEGVRMIKTLPGVKTVCGLSNISFGLPGRGVLNSTFLVMAIACGLDAAIVDPTNKNTFFAVKSGKALLGRDEYCMDYITAFRESHQQ